MSGLSRGVRGAILLRSLLVQGSWNFETLLGTGFAFAILPAMRVRYRGDPEGLRAALARHTALFNSHPYLATVAMGAVARLESDGVEPRVLERFKSAMRGSLGALGDQLVWTAWRPATLLVGLALILVGLPWWAGVAGFLLAYNGLHLGLRAWGLRVGSEAGLDVGRRLREAPLQALGARAADLGAFLCGAVVVLPLLSVPDSGFPIAATSAFVALGATAGLWLGYRTTVWMAWVAGLAWIVSLYAGWVT